MRTHNFVVMAITRRVFLLGLLVALPAAEHGLKLPPNVKACSRNDPQFNECIIQRARETVPYMAKGDPKYKIPTLDPLAIPEVKLERGSGPTGFTISGHDVTLTGLKDSQVDSFKVDLKNLRVETALSVPRLELIGKYDVEGKVLALPIKGNGNSNITLEGNTLSYAFDVELEDRGGEKYMKAKNDVLLFEPSRVYFHFDNLFNGDQALGDAMNKALNENWRDVFDELKPDILDASKQIVKALVDSIASNYPYNEIFPETV